VGDAVAEEKATSRVGEGIAAANSVGWGCDAR
jgi:hypothetical protein